MQKQWQYKPLPEKEKIAVFAKLLNISFPLATILLQRGITTYQEAELFFNPTLSLLHDPMQMKNMNIAIETIARALVDQDLICLYGDYDVDGTTSIALLYDALKKLQANISYYVSDRYKEGYGISEQGVFHCIKEQVKLVIALDCGTKALSQIRKLRDAGIDVIVCDHHHPGPTLPPAVAMLNPKQKDCLYPFKELSGCGVAFKLLQALAKRGLFPKESLTSYLDLVSVSIAADIVPMIGENRILAYHGLRQLNEAPRPGLAALKKQFNKTLPFTVSDIVFKIAPFINAPGRISHATKSVNLLIAPTEAKVAPWLVYLEKENQIRKELDHLLITEALALIAADKTYAKRYTTVLFNSKWPKGIVGIGAARCIEHHYKPTIFLTQQGDKAVGSARSVAGFNIYDAIAACDDLLTTYGGHAYAAGLSLPLTRLSAFQRRFEEVVQRSISQTQQTRSQRIDVPLSLREITPAFFHILERMQPFGPSHPRPVFLSEPVTVQSYEVYQQKHLALKVKEYNNKYVWKAIGFDMAHLFPYIKPKATLSIVYTIQKEHYQGYTSYSLFLKDIRPFSQKGINH